MAGGPAVDTGVPCIEVVEVGDESCRPRTDDGGPYAGCQRTGCRDCGGLVAD